MGRAVVTAGSYARFLKLEHTLFSLPLLYAGAFLAARGLPDSRLLLLILVAGVAARTAALALNRLIDRAIDARNPRTRERELPAGRLRPSEAWALAVAGAAVYVAAAFAIAPICAWLSPAPLAVFVLYPYLKRFTPLAHFGVGLGLAAAPLGGFMAVRQSFQDPAPALLLGAFTLLWVAGFDVIYSTLDEGFDREAGLRSLPAALGRRRALGVSALLHILAFVPLAVLFWTELRSWVTLPFLAAAGVLLLLEQRKAEDVQLAFFQINAVLGFVVFGFVASGTL